MSATAAAQENNDGRAVPVKHRVSPNSDMIRPVPQTPDNEPIRLVRLEPIFTIRLQNRRSSCLRLFPAAGLCGWLCTNRPSSALFHGQSDGPIRHVTDMTPAHAGRIHNYMFLLIFLSRLPPGCTAIAVIRPHPPPANASPPTAPQRWAARPKNSARTSNPK